VRSERGERREREASSHFVFSPLTQAYHLSLLTPHWCGEEVMMVIAVMR